MFTVTVEAQLDDYKHKGGNKRTYITESLHDAELVGAREVLSRLSDNDFHDLWSWSEYFLSRDFHDVWEWYETHGDSFFEGEYVPWTFRVTITNQSDECEQVSVEQMEKYFDELEEIYGDLPEGEEQ